MQKTRAATDNPVMDRGCRLLLLLLAFLDLRRNPATGNRLGLALVLRLRLATVDPVDKPRTFFRFRL
jgi:hypothetical protein